MKIVSIYKYNRAFNRGLKIKQLQTPAEQICQFTVEYLQLVRDGRATDKILCDLLLKVKILDPNDLYKLATMSVKISKLDSTILHEIARLMQLELLEAIVDDGGFDPSKVNIEDPDNSAPDFNFGCGMYATNIFPIHECAKVLSNLNDQDPEYDDNVKKLEKMLSIFERKSKSIINVNHCRLRFQVLLSVAKRGSLDKMEKTLDHLFKELESNEVSLVIAYGLEHEVARNIAKNRYNFDAIILLLEWLIENFKKMESSLYSYYPDYSSSDMLQLILSRTYVLNSELAKRILVHFKTANPKLNLVINEEFIEQEKQNKLKSDEFIGEIEQIIEEIMFESNAEALAQLNESLSRIWFEWQDNMIPLKILVRYKTKFSDTLLHAAAKLGNYSLTSNLIHKGVDINTINSEGYTPFYYAAKQGAQIDNNRSRYQNIIIALIYGGNYIELTEVFSRGHGCVNDHEGTYDLKTSRQLGTKRADLFKEKEAILIAARWVKKSLFLKWIITSMHTRWPNMLKDKDFVENLKANLSYNTNADCTIDFAVPKELKESFSQRISKIDEDLFFKRYLISSITPGALTVISLGLVFYRVGAVDYFRCIDTHTQILAGISVLTVATGTFIFAKNYPLLGALTSSSIIIAGCAGDKELNQKGVVCFLIASTLLSVAANYLRTNDFNRAKANMTKLFNSHGHKE